MSYGALNEPAEIPPALDRWNWGAFFLNWIWGIGNSVWIALLMFVPFVNIAMIFVLGARGSRWAWENRAWRDAEHFRRTQRRWAIAGLLVWLMIPVLAAGSLYTVFQAMRSSDAYALTLSTAVADPAVVGALGDDITPSFLFSGSVNTEMGGRGRASFSIPVAGTKAAGTILSQVVREGGQWQVRSLVVVVEDGTEIPVITNGRAISTGFSA